jgi:hypothetical protein
MVRVCKKRRSAVSAAERKFVSVSRMGGDRAGAKGRLWFFGLAGEEPQRAPEPLSITPHG